jgi:hypothetical protein
MNQKSRKRENCVDKSKEKSSKHFISVEIVKI